MHLIVGRGVEGQKRDEISSKMRQWEGTSMNTLIVICVCWWFRGHSRAAQPYFSVCQAVQHVNDFIMIACEFISWMKEGLVHVLQWKCHSWILYNCAFQNATCLRTLNSRLIHDNMRQNFIHPEENSYRQLQTPHVWTVMCLLKISPIKLTFRMAERKKETSLTFKNSTLSAWVPKSSFMHLCSPSSWNSTSSKNKIPFVYLTALIIIKGVWMRKLLSGSVSACQISRAAGYQWWAL